MAEEQNEQDCQNHVSSQNLAPRNENLAKLTDVYTGSDDRVVKLKLTVGDIAFGKRSKPITRMVYLKGELHVVTLLKTE